jgi:hypothetical protein
VRDAKFLFSNKPEFTCASGKETVMVEFEYQPWRKIVVHEVIKYPLEQFLSQASLGIEAGQIGRPLMWADNIIFEIAHFRDTEDIINQKLAGVIHWSTILYTVLEGFQPEFKVAGNIRIPVIDVSSNAVFKEMASWIRNNFEKQ